MFLHLIYMCTYMYMYMILIFVRFSQNILIF